MLRKAIIITIILSLTIMILPAGAALQFKDVPDGYWAKSNIDFVSGNGYMVGYGDRFGINDNITEGQYVAVLCRIFGYENQSPLTCEEPARALGLLKDNETINVTENLKRGDLAKYTIRAFEMLNSNVTYPEYLEAYKGIITDYNTLDYDLKTIALKCVEKGLLAGNADGSFAPDSYSTRAQAAAFIHRLFSQEERNKAMPVFAAPDYEFEAFMATEEAAEYCSTLRIDKVVDGRIIWNSRVREDLNTSGSYGTSLLPTNYIKESNRIAYEMLKNLVTEARKNGNYVVATYLKRESDGHKICYFSYYFNQKAGRNGSRSYSFQNVMYLYPHKIYYDGIDEVQQSKNTYFEWYVGSLFDDNDDDLIMIKFKNEKYVNALRNAFIIAYGNDTGMQIFSHAMSEYDNNREAGIKGLKYINYSVQMIDNIEIQNCDDEGGGLYIGTSY